MNGPGGAPRHELGRGSAGRWAGVALATLVAVSGTASPGVGQQPAPPVAASDSAIVRGAAIRDTLTRPPGAPPFDAVDALGLPLEAVAVPLRLVVDGAAWLVGRVTLPGAPTFPQRAIDAMRGWGAVPSVTSLGQRSGVALRLDLIRYRPFFLESGISIRGSQHHRAGLRWGDPEGGVEASYLFRRDAEPRFWGIGPDSREEDRSVFLRDRQLAEVRATGAWGPFGVAGALGYEDDRVDRGFGSGPDLQDVFDPLPFGADRRTSFFRADAALTLDLTHRALFQRRGVRLGVSGQLFRGVDDTPSDFHRLGGEAVVYVPLNPRQLLAVHGFAQATRLDDGEGIPFFHLSSVGGAAGLRGFSTDRFRDRDAAGVMLEWRYEIWRDLHQRSRAEFFVFFDEAGVTPSLGDLSSSDLRASYGFGLRFVTLDGLVGYASLGFGEEGARVRVGDRWVF